MSDRENSDTNSDSSDENFYDLKLATDSVDFSDADFNVIDDDEVDDINNIIYIFWQLFLRRLYSMGEGYYNKTPIKDLWNATSGISSIRAILSMNMFSLIHSFIR